MNVLPKQTMTSLKKVSLLGLACFSLLAACKDPKANASTDVDQPQSLGNGIDAPSTTTTATPKLAVASEVSAPAQDPRAASSSLTSVPDEPKIAQQSSPDWNAISTWQGRWKTTYGEMNLQEFQPSPGQGETLTNVSGIYNTDDGKIEAVIYDTGLAGYWIETSSARKCKTQKQGSYYWGRIEFSKEIPNPDKFTGRWSYCNEELGTSKWTGERIGSTGRPSSGWQPQASHRESNPNFQALWQGNWNTSEGSMNLQFPTEGQDNTILRGSYNQDGGRIEGYIQQYILKGYWAENSSAQRCSIPRMGTYYWGRIEFYLNDAGSDFTGKWSYCDAEPDASWTGQRA